VSALTVAGPGRSRVVGRFKRGIFVHIAHCIRLCSYQSVTNDVPLAAVTSCKCYFSKIQFSGNQNDGAWIASSKKRQSLESEKFSGWSFHAKQNSTRHDFHEIHSVQ
jgi:hypothetical protein